MSARNGGSCAGLRVVVVDDSEIVRDMVRDVFELAGAEVHTIETAIGLSGLLRRVTPDAVILDVNMPAIPGDEAIARVRSVCPLARIVLFSASPTLRSLAAIHGVACVDKEDPAKLLAAVRGR